MREIMLELVHARVIKRRDFTVLFRAQARQPGFARVDNKRLALAFPGYGIDEITEKFVAVLVVNPDTRFDRDWNRHHVAHRFDAIRHQLGVAHQARTKHPVLHAIGRAADVKVNFVITALLRQFRAVRQRSRVAAAEL
ncbi:hypothetical protein D3C76_1232390 [compost metagenome]